jgi:hypothetical protein
MLINDAQITGSLTVNASSSFQNIIVSGNIIPDTNNIRNLGSVDKYFKEIYVSTGSINFVDSGSVKSTISSAPGGGIQIGSVVITTSSIAFVDSTGSVTQNIAQSSSVGQVSDYATSASFNSYTSSTNTVLSSLQTTSASVNVSVGAINTFTSSTSARLGSIETITSSNTARINALETKSASVDTTNTTQNARLSALETTSASVDNLNTTQNTRLTNLENKTGSLATTGSNTFIGTQVFSGSLYITTDLIVQGSSSIQNITGSSVNIGTNKVVLNTANPAVRYAGISVIDSGSTGLTGSILWDSTNNNWLYQNPSGSGYTSAKFIAGPQSQTLGSELGLVNNYIVKAVGDDHISSSAIYDDGTTIGLKLNTEITGSLKVSSTITATNLAGVWSGSAQLPSGVVSGSGQVIYSSLSSIPAGIVSGSSQISLSGFTTANLSENTNLYYTDARVKTKLNAETVVSGSGQITLSSTSGFGTYINQALLTTSGPTFGSVTSTGAVTAINGGSYTATLGNIQASWAGSTTYPTLYGSHQDRWVMHINPHISYVANGVNGFTGTNTGAKVRMASDGAANHYWDMGVGANAQGTDKYSIGRDDTAFFNITSAGYSSFSGKITLGTFPNSTTNTGEAWIGRASDRNQGTMTVQLGGNSSSSRSFEVVDYAWTVVLFSVSSGGTATASGDVVAYSDRRIKENIVTITDPLDKVLRLRGVSYNRTDLEDKSTKIGFIAQEVQNVVPEVVTYNKEQDRYGVSYGNMTALLVEAIKEQQIKIDNLTIEVENLKKPKGL